MLAGLCGPCDQDIWDNSRGSGGTLAERIIPARVERTRRQERRRIPDGFTFDRVPGLSREVVQRFSQVRPETLGQASRIPGVTPAAVAVLGAFLEKSSQHVD